MKYRSRLAIVAQLLEIAEKGPINKTRMMYGAYMSYSQINEYLPVLVEGELLSQDLGLHSESYALTPKGLEFLQLYGKMAKLLKEKGKSLLADEGLGHAPRV